MARVVNIQFKNILFDFRQLYARHCFAACYLSTFASKRMSRSFCQVHFPLSSNCFHSYKNRLPCVVHNGNPRSLYQASMSFSSSSACIANENVSKEEPSKADSENDSKTADSDKPLSQRQRLTRTFAAYGTTGVVFHTCISLTSLGTCYMIVSSGIDMVMLLESIGIASKTGMQSALASGASTFVIAYACHKVFMPVRIFLTVTCTPIIVNRLKRLGFLKDKAKTKTPSS